jgi:hypothetical protein
MYGSPVATVELPADDPLASVSDPRLHRLYAYLEAKRGEREFPAPGDIAHPAYRDYMLDRYAELIKSRRPAGGIYNLFMGNESKRYQYLRVPLSTDGRTIDMVIVAIILGPPAH